MRLQLVLESSIRSLVTALVHRLRHKLLLSFTRQGGGPCPEIDTALLHFIFDEAPISSRPALLGLGVDFAGVE